MLREFLQVSLRLSLQHLKLQLLDVLLLTLNPFTPWPISNSGINKRRTQKLVPPLSNLVYLQALILMIIATENSGPSFLQNNHWFGLAITTATNMKLHLNWAQETGDSRADPNSNAKLGRRAWLILFILDSWHAPGTFGPLLVPAIGAKLVDSDLALLGAPAYHMFRKCQRASLMIPVYC